MNKKLNVGIAGYGIIGKLRHQIIDQHPSLKTIAVCDKNFEHKSNLEGNIRCYSDYQSLLQEPLDILFVSLPNYLAPETTIAGLEKGLHIFCEKPPGRSVSDVIKVHDIKKKHDHLQLKYGFNHRYHDSVRDALKIIQSEELGEIINIRGVYGKSQIIPFEGNWRSERKYAGGGILLDQGIHMVDLMRLFCGEFTDIQSFISNDFWKNDVEDNAYAIMRNDQGVIAMLHSSATQWQHHFSLEISLSEGYLTLHGILTGTKSYGEEKLVIGRKNDSLTGTDREEIITYLNDNSWKNEIDEFAEAIANQRTIRSGTVEEALGTMKLVFKIYCADPIWKRNYEISED